MFPPQKKSWWLCHVLEVQAHTVLVTILQHVKTSNQRLYTLNVHSAISIISQQSCKRIFFSFLMKKTREKWGSGGRCLGSLSSSISLFHDLKCDLTLPSLNFSLCKMEVTVLAFSQDCWNIKWNNVCKTPVNDLELALLSLLQCLLNGLINITPERFIHLKNI